MTINAALLNGHGPVANGHHVVSNGHGPASTTSDRLATRAIHVGSAPNAATGAVIPPISLSTTYAQSSIGVHQGFEYTRSLNPNRLDLETLVASLEGADEPEVEEDGGRPLPKALAVSSGSAATATVVGAVVGQGGHIVSMSDVYGGTFRYFTRVAKELGISSTFVDMSSSDPDAAGSHEAVTQRLEAAITERTRLIWIETPTNPTLRMVDIAAVAEIGRRRGIPVAVDNTFMTPFYQQPLSLGADIVIHSATKYLGGHSDVLLGLIITNNPAILSKARFLQNAHGAVPGAFDSWLTQRGLKTLELRMRQHGRNALKLAQWLETTGKRNGWVESVYYNGLASNPAAPLAWRQLPLDTREELLNAGFSPQTGFPYGGMISFRIARSAPETASNETDPSGTAERFLESTRLFTLAESLGGVESLAELPSKMTHASVAAEERHKLGIDNRLIRLSSGVEDVRDLLRDVEQALRKAVVLA